MDSSDMSRLLEQSGAERPSVLRMAAQMRAVNDGLSAMGLSRLEFAFTNDPSEYDARVPSLLETLLHLLTQRQREEAARRRADELLQQRTSEVSHYQERLSRERHAAEAARRELTSTESRLRSAECALHVVTSRLEREVDALTRSNRELSFKATQAQHASRRMEMERDRLRVKLTRLLQERGDQVATAVPRMTLGRRPSPSPRGDSRQHDPPRRTRLLHTPSGLYDRPSSLPSTPQPFQPLNVTPSRGSGIPSPQPHRVYTSKPHPPSSLSPHDCLPTSSPHAQQRHPLVIRGTRGHQGRIPPPKRRPLCCSSPAQPPPVGTVAAVCLPPPHPPPPPPPPFASSVNEASQRSPDVSEIHFDGAVVVVGTEPDQRSDDRPRRINQDRGGNAAVELVWALGLETSPSASSESSS